MNFHNYIMGSSILLLFTMCRPSQVEPVKNETVNQQKEQFISLNRYWVERDMILIDSYARRNQLNLTRTQSGLSYQIIRKGKGRKISPNDHVTFSYRLSLLDGTLCNSSDSTGVKEIQVGAGNIERGMEEGLIYLHAGDSAIFILPPHLAYGIMGDGKCIPPRSCLVYHVRINTVKLPSKQ